MWDSDTLRSEGKGYTELLNVIAGRFPRNPPVYYEMRLARVEEQIIAEPDNLALYDDAGAACDRLHRPAEAIAWMEKKAAALERTPDEEHQYRYHANLGTFLIHQWLAGGADVGQPGGREGADHIRRAIEINPDAHFGREQVQLDAIEWILEERAPGEIERSTDPAPRNLFRHAQWEHHFPPGTDRDGAIEGLAGMVALGAAWESVDVFRTIHRGLDGDASVQRLVSLRVAELLADGKVSLADDFPEHYRVSKRGLKEVDHIDKWYRKARAAADAWQAARTGYVETQIAAGRHPDTHADFWDGFDEDQHPLPKLPNKRGYRSPFAVLWLLVPLGIAFFLLSQYVLRKVCDLIDALKRRPSSP